MRYYKRQTVERLSAYKVTAQQLQAHLPAGHRTGKVRTQYKIDGRNWHSTVELVELDGMHYGGPVYVKCPHCQQRARYVFALQKGLRCRTCYGLTNVSTQTAPGGNGSVIMHMRRVERAQQQLEACTQALSRTRPGSQNRRRLLDRQAVLIGALQHAIKGLRRKARLDRRPVEGVTEYTAQDGEIAIDTARIVRRQCRTA